MLDLPDTLRGRHFTRVADFSSDELELVLDTAARIKDAPREEQQVLPGRSLGMIFQKPSTRTRVSFEVGIAQLGGHALYLRSDDLQLGTVERVIDNPKEHIFDGIVMRTDGGLLWVDAPEVQRINERRVTLNIDAATAAAELTSYAPGAPEYRANVRGGRLSRFFGGGWKRH